jgi:hypothetical protein
VLFTSFCFLVGWIPTGGRRAGEDEEGRKGHSQGAAHGPTTVKPGMCFFKWNYMSVANRDRHHQVVRGHEFVCLSAGRFSGKKDKSEEKRGTRQTNVAVKSKWLSVNVKNNNKENFFFIKIVKKEGGHFKYARQKVATKITQREKEKNKK